MIRLPIKSEIKATYVTGHNLDSMFRIYSELDMSELHGCLVDAWYDYCRWVTEGKVPYHTSAYSYDAKKPAVQYYYNPYENKIEWHARTNQQYSAGHYTFDLKLSDSPEGDTWVRGIFVIDGNELTIVEQKSYNT